MEASLQELERAAEADPDNLGLQRDLIRAQLRQPPPDAEAQSQAFFAILKSPRLERAAVVAWVQERCDRHQLTALLEACAGHPAPIIRDRALWILGACDLDWIGPLLIDLAERHPLVRRQAPELLRRLDSPRVRRWLAGDSG